MGQHTHGRGRRPGLTDLGLAELVDAAAGAYQTPHFETIVAELCRQADDSTRVVMRRLDDRIDQLWVNGWAPADLVHVVGRRLSDRHAALAIDRVVEDGRRRMAQCQSLHPQWRAQVSHLEEAAHGEQVPGSTPPTDEPRLKRLLEVLVVAGRLPGIPATLPPPGDARNDLPRGHHLDGRMLQRVRALLAKAESTNFLEEAEALTAKAQELIARHAIDEVLLHTAEDVGEPAVRRIPVDDPYATAKAYLVSEVGRANRCRVVHSPDMGWVTVFGFDQDADAVELLAASLLAQATAAMAHQGPRRDRSGRSRTRAFRRAFVLGFGQRIGERLRRAADDQVEQAAASNGRLAPVLAARQDLVVAAERRAFPDLRRRPTSVSHAGGWSQGRVAADRADLEVTRRRLPGA